MVPVIEALVAAGVQAQISVDTMKAEVAERALAAGATLVNDVTALRAAPEIAELTAAAVLSSASCTWQSPPNQPPAPPRYATSSRRSRASSRSAWRLRWRTAYPEEQIILDPGLRQLRQGRRARTSSCSGACPSWSRSAGRCSSARAARASSASSPAGGRTSALAGTIATNVIAYERGARIFRVHDVAPLCDALTVTAATLAG